MSSVQGSPQVGRGRESRAQDYSLGNWHGVNNELQNCGIKILGKENRYFQIMFSE